jgi:copper homeostasis protein
MKPGKIEICANSVTSCVEAQKGGAMRVELCAGIPEGGTTPSQGTIAVTRELLEIPIHVIIRPRAGDFLYSPEEIRVMERDIAVAKDCGADGVVIGCLTPEGEIDYRLTQRLVECADGMSVTFHRAFDMCTDPMKALEELINLGCNRILTSGQMPTAEEGIPLLRELVEKAAGRIIILPGCGINEKNIRKIAEETGAEEFHLSAREAIQSGMIYRNPKVSMGGTVQVDEYAEPRTSAERVRQTLASLAGNK